MFKCGPHHRALRLKFDVLESPTSVQRSEMSLGFLAGPFSKLADLFAWPLRPENPGLDQTPFQRQWNESVG